MINELTKYWLWLAMALGPGARTEDLVSAFPDPKELYEATDTERYVSGVFTRIQLEKLKAVPLAKAEEIIENTKANGWHIACPGDDDYPEKLLTLTDMPLVLFYDGSLGCLREGASIGVVGTRNPTRDGVRAANKISADMAAMGAVIVSGGALGIDSAAHEGALSQGKETVCVLGCGLGTDYLKTNACLREQIKRQGALVSEYLPFTPASKFTFPLRNRIISGLSDGVLVVEAGEKSGSLITARYATGQNRDVFAIPGSIMAREYSGANRLIKDGAGVIMNAADVLSGYCSKYPELDLTKEAVAPGISTGSAGEKCEENPPQNSAENIKPKPAVRRQVPPELGENAARIYAVLGDEPIHTDEIAVMSRLPVSEVTSALLMLELEGLIRCETGKNYCII